MKEFTHYPLTVRQGSDYTAVGYWAGISFVPIAYMVENETYDSPLTTRDAEENAHMCAASRDLYRELKHLVRLLESKGDCGIGVPGLVTLNGARVALAKAEGNGVSA